MSGGRSTVGRREFLGAAISWLGGLAAAAGGPALAAEEKTVSAKRLPRWRGFNLTEKTTLAGSRPFEERDFEWIARWKLDFARIPLDYRIWTDASKPGEIDGERGERALQEIDRVVEMGKSHGIHVDLNLHRAPGYCVNPPAEPLDLWKDERAEQAFAAQWALLARRYKGIPSERLSFDLLNEPGDLPAADYVRVVRRAAAAIRGVDPGRLIIADGLRWGRVPVVELAGDGIAQSTRGYDPMQVSHYRAGWIRGSDRWPEPSWPLEEKEKPFDRERIRKERIEPWKALEAKGVGVHVGEWGAFNRTPRAVVLAWMKDCLALWREAGWGWALWNLRGAFGVVDSKRADTRYEDLDGHQLDREMLELLLAG